MYVEFLVNAIISPIIPSSHENTVRNMGQNLQSSFSAEAKMRGQQSKILSYPLI